MTVNPEAHLRALVVDDERLARENLVDLLGDFPQVAVVGEGCDVNEAAKLAAKLRPDLIFLDIQMPGGSGFDLLNRLVDPPLIVFVTAYDQFAIRAFRVNALDYLLKPIDPGRLAISLTRAVARNSPCPVPTIPFNLADQVFINTGQRAFFMPVAEIAAIVAERNYSHVVDVRGRRHMVRMSMRAWEKRLPADFVTLDRSFIINRRHVRSWSFRDRKAEIRLGDIAVPFMLGRTGYRRFKERVAECVASAAI